MTLIPRTRFARERMDRPDVNPAHLADALDHVAAVNRWLGGTRALLRHLPDAIPDTLHGALPGALPASHKRPDPPGLLHEPGVAPALRVLDVGTGSGDLPLAVAAWARRHDRRLEVTALDLHQGTLAVAAARTAAHPAIRLVQGDALSLPFPTGSFHLALLSMTLHHMDGDALVHILEELGRSARGGHVMVGELERSVPSYLGARVLAATVWRRNPVTRHDGPLSVLRAFTAAELLELARAAGLANARVHRHPLFRLVLVAGAGE